MEHVPTSADLLNTSSDRPVPADLTVLVAPGFVGKRFSLSEDGHLRKEAAGNHTEWSARRFSIGNALLMNELLTNMTPNMAIVLGVAPTLPMQASLSRYGDRRSQDTFFHQPGPGWLLLDYDTAGMPDDVRVRIVELGGPLNAMMHVWPELRAACRVFKPSSSAGVYKLGDPPPTEYAGFHLYVLIADQRTSVQSLRALQARAWQAGLGWIKLSKNGVPLVRSIFDSAVGTPERLTFAGPPELGAGVGRIVFPNDYQEGQVLAAPHFPANSDWQRRIGDEKERCRPVSRRMEREWIKAEARKAVRAGIPVRKALQAAKLRGCDQVLTDDDVIELNDGTSVRVGDLLDLGPPSGGKMSLPSPVDGLDYGRGKATLLWDPVRSPVIMDHAHGLQRLFRFARFDGQRELSGRTKKFLDVPQISVSSRREMDSLLRQADQSNVRDRVIAVAKRLFWSVPAEWGLPEMLDWVEDRTRHCPLPHEFGGS